MSFQLSRSVNEAVLIAHCMLMLAMAIAVLACAAHGSSVAPGALPSRGASAHHTAAAARSQRPQQGIWG